MNVENEKYKNYLIELLNYIVENKCSDLHLISNSKPYVRKSGTIIQLIDKEIITIETMTGFINEIIGDFKIKRKEFIEDKQVDLSYSIEEQRFRVNIFTQMNKHGIVIRVINNKIPSLSKLGLPPIVDKFSEFNSGLVLITGPTGSGKSTTLAAIIDKINSTQKKHILTVEDPIEYTHKNKLSIVNQREVGQDVLSFDSAIKAALREDPDIMLVGEMRDLETISNAITMAETGHLVFGTLHTMSAPQTINRIIDVFDSNAQQQIKIQLASALQAVVCQQLVTGIDGNYKCATEVMLVNDAIRGIIRDGRNIAGISDNISMNRKSIGTQTLDQSLASLVNRKLIDIKTAEEISNDRENLKRFIMAGLI